MNKERGTERGASSFVWSLPASAEGFVSGCCATVALAAHVACRSVIQIKEFFIRCSYDPRR